MDPFTLTVASALVAGTMAASMLLLYRASSRQRCLLDWSLAGLCFLASNLIGAFAETHRLGFLVTPALGNTLYIAGHLGILVGIRRHLGLRPRYALLILLALTVLGLHTLPFAHGAASHRVLLFTPIIGGINLGAAWLMWRQRDAEARPAYLPLMALELLFMAAMSARNVAILVGDSYFATFAGVQFLHACGSLMTLVFLSVSTMGCALIVTHHQELALRRASLTDVLTGWLNRRALHDIGRREFHRCQRTGTPLFFIAFDIDHFKSINDRYGHSVGDAAISHVAMLSARALRGYDTLFRIGGEEFAVLLSGGSLQDVQGIAGRLHELIASTPLALRELEVPMTVSVGLAAARSCDAQWEDVLRRADEAMYHAKQQGRNRVSVHGVDVGRDAGLRLHAVA